MSPASGMLSVIIPSYNAGATLGDQLDALTRQGYAGAWEIIVSDNRSTDNTAALVERYRERLPQLRYLAAFEKQGRSYACNAGARAARGDVLLFCDADDVVADDWVARLAGAARDHVFVGGAVETAHLNGDAPWRPNPVPSSTKLALDFLPQAPGANMAIWRSAFDDVGGFTEDIPPCEDIDISWKLQLKGYQLHDAPDAVVSIRYRPTYTAMWRQLISAAECHVFLYRTFRSSGMRRYPASEVLGRYRWLAGSTLGLMRARIRRHPVDQTKVGQYIKRAAVCWGRIRGSLRYRTLYL